MLHKTRKLLNFSKSGEIVQIATKIYSDDEKKERYL